MSHFTKCDLKLNNLDAVKKALDDLGWAYTEAEAEVGATVRGWRGQTLEAAMSINMGKYDVGVVQNEDGSYHLTADWWGVETTKGLSEAEFKNKLNHRYSYHRVVKAPRAASGPGSSMKENRKLAMIGVKRKQSTSAR